MGFGYRPLRSTQSSDLALELAEVIESRASPRSRIGLLQGLSLGALELALANACGALGYGVLFTGHLLKSAGVDLIAFDETSGRAYVVSGTIGNDIIEKLRTWLAMEPLIVQDLLPEWTPRPVIITSQSRSTLITEELRYAIRVVY